MYHIWTILDSGRWVIRQLLFIPFGRFQIVSFFLVKRVTTLPTVVFPTQDLNRIQDVRKNKTSLTEP